MTHILREILRKRSPVEQGVIRERSGNLVVEEGKPRTLHCSLQTGWQVSPELLERDLLEPDFWSASAISHRSTRHLNLRSLLALFRFLAVPWEVDGHKRPQPNNITNRRRSAARPRRRRSRRPLRRQAALASVHQRSALRLFPR